MSQNRPLRRVAIVVFAADEGLCGAFNLLLYKKLLETLKEYDSKVKLPVFVYPVGRKLANDIKQTKGVEVMPIPDLFEGCRSGRSDLRSLQEHGNTDHQSGAAASVDSSGNKSSFR